MSRSRAPVSTLALFSLVALVALVTATDLIATPPPPAAAQSPYPARRGLIANGTDMAISEARLENEFLDRIGDPYGLDGLALLVSDCFPEPESYLDGALVHYGLADAPGVMNSDAVVWFICEDPRFVGFFWGADNPYAGRLDEDAVADAMVQDLRDGNFTGAIADGLDIVADSLGDVAGSTGSEAGADSAPASAPAAASRDAGSNRARDALLVAVAGVGGWWWWRRRRASGTKSGPADREAKDPTAAMRPSEAVTHRLAELNARLTPADPDLGRLILLYEPMGDQAMLAISHRHETMIERLRTLEASVAEIPVRAAAAEVDPEARADALYREALLEADALRDYVLGLPREADHAEMLIERAAVLAVEARKAIDVARTTYATAAADEDLPPADTAMAFPSRLADRAETALTAGDRLQAGELAEDASEAAASIVRAAEELRATEAAISAAGIAFDRVDDFAQSSWSDIAGNGSEAEESLDAARDMLRRVIEAAPSDFGEDEAAGFSASMRRVFEELTRARGLTDAIEQRLARILEARDTASGMLETIGKEIDDARAWLASPEVDRDVDPSPLDVLATAEAQLATARAAIADPRPDWIEIRRALDEADRLVDTAQGNARDQQSRMEALRRQNGTAQEEALGALEKVEKYVDSHRRDVGVHATDMVRDAREARRRLERNDVDDLEDAALAAALESTAGAWRKIRELADAAYAAAAEDVRAAESRRRDYIPRSTWIGPSVPIPRVRRSWPMPIDINTGSGPIISGGSRSSGRSSWGSRPTGGSSRRSSGGGGRPTSGRRGGGRGW